jgi:hypothetical protein
MDPAPRNPVTRAIALSALPAFVALTALVVVSVVFHTGLLALAWLGLLLLGFIPEIALIEMAEAELARGRSAGHFRSRSVVLAASFFVALLAAIALAFTAALTPAPAVWVALQVIGTVPATAMAAVFTSRSHRLPTEPYTGPAFTFRRR